MEKQINPLEIRIKQIVNGGVISISHNSMRVKVSCTVNLNGTVEFTREFTGEELISINEAINMTISSSKNEVMECYLLFQINFDIAFDLQKCMELFYSYGNLCHSIKDIKFIELLNYNNSYFTRYQNINTNNKNIKASLDKIGRGLKDSASKATLFNVENCIRIYKQSYFTKDSFSDKADSPQKVNNDKIISIKESEYRQMSLPPFFSVENIFELSKLFAKNRSDFESIIGKLFVTIPSNNNDLMQEIQKLEKYKTNAFIYMSEYLYACFSAKTELQGRYDLGVVHSVHEIFNKIQFSFMNAKIHIVKVDCPAYCFHILFPMLKFFISPFPLFYQVLFCNPETNIKEYLNNFKKFGCLKNELLIVHPEYLNEANLNILKNEIKMMTNWLKRSDNIKLFIISSSTLIDDDKFVTNIERNIVDELRKKSIDDFPMKENVNFQLVLSNKSGCGKTHFIKENTKSKIIFIDKNCPHFPRNSQNSIAFNFAPEFFEDNVSFWDELYGQMFLGVFVEPENIFFNKEINNILIRKLTIFFEEPIPDTINNLNEFPFPLDKTDVVYITPEIFPENKKNDFTPKITFTPKISTLINEYLEKTKVVIEKKKTNSNSDSSDEEESSCDSSPTSVADSLDQNIFINFSQSNIERFIQTFENETENKTFFQFIFDNYRLFFETRIQESNAFDKSLRVFFDVYQYVNAFSEEYKNCFSYDNKFKQIIAFLLIVQSALYVYDLVPENSKSEFTIISFNEIFDIRTNKNVTIFTTRGKNQLLNLKNSYGIEINDYEKLLSNDNFKFHFGLKSMNQYDLYYSLAQILTNNKEIIQMICDHKILDFFFDYNNYSKFNASNKKLDDFIKNIINSQNDENSKDFSCFRKLLLENNKNSDLNSDKDKYLQFIQRIQDIILKGNEYDQSIISFVLTWPSFCRAIILFSRIKLKQSAVLEGETGCGKTSFIKMIFGLTKKVDSYVKFCDFINIHGDINRENIQDCFDLNQSKNIFFLDEFNTTETVPFLEYKFLEREGTQFIGAINPRIHTMPVSTALSKVGMKQNNVTISQKIYLTKKNPNDEKKTKKEIDIGSFKYFVHPLKKISELIIDCNPMVFDPETENIFLPDEEKDCIKRNLFFMMLNTNIFKKFDKLYEFVEKTSSFLCDCISWMRTLMQERAVVSFRDVIDYYDFFNEIYQQTNNIDNSHFFSVLSVFLLRLPKVIQIDKNNNEVKKHLTMCNQKFNLALEISNEWENCSYIELFVQKSFKNYFKSTHNIDFDKIMSDFKEYIFTDNWQSIICNNNFWKFDSFLYHVFIIKMCIKLGKTAFIIGLPGTSKTFALKALKEIEKKKVYVNTYMCSRGSSSEGLKSQIYDTAFIRLENKNMYALFALEEMGLANKNERRPLKYLHFALDLGIEINNINHPTYYKVPCVGVSNYAMDFANMNRGILIFTDIPSVDELISVFSFNDLVIKPSDNYQAYEVLFENTDKTFTNTFFKCLWGNDTSNEISSIALRSIYTLYKTHMSILKEDKEVTLEIFCQVARELFNARRIHLELIKNYNIPDKTFDLISGIFPEKMRNFNHSINNMLILIDRLRNTKTTSHKSICIQTKRYEALEYINLLVRDLIPSDIIKFNELLDSKDFKVAKNLKMESEETTKLSFFYPEDFKLPLSTITQNSLKKFISLLTNKDERPIIIGNHPIFDSLLDVLNVDIQENDQDYNVLIGSDGFSWEVKINNLFYIILILNVEDSDSSLDEIPLPLLDRMENIYIDWDSIKYLVYFQWMKDSVFLKSKYDELKKDKTIRQFIDFINEKLFNYLEEQQKSDSECNNRFSDNGDSTDEKFHLTPNTLIRWYKNEYNKSYKFSDELIWEYFKRFQDDHLTCVICTNSIISNEILLNDVNKVKIFEDDIIKSKEDFLKKIDIVSDEMVVIIKCSMYSQLHDQFLKDLISIFKDKKKYIFIIIYYQCDHHKMKTSLNWPIFWMDEISTSEILNEPINSKKFLELLEQHDDRLLKNFVSIIIEQINFGNNGTVAKNKERFEKWLESVYNSSYNSIIKFNLDCLHVHNSSHYSNQANLIKKMLQILSDKLLPFINVVFSHLIYGDGNEYKYDKKIYDFLLESDLHENQVDFIKDQDYKFVDFLCIFKKDCIQYANNSPIIKPNELMSTKFLEVVKNASPFFEFIKKLCAKKINTESDKINKVINNHQYNNNDLKYLYEAYDEIKNNAKLRDNLADKIHFHKKDQLTAENPHFRIVNDLRENLDKTVFFSNGLKVNFLTEFSNKDHKGILEKLFINYRTILCINIYKLLHYILDNDFKNEVNVFLYEIIKFEEKYNKNTFWPRYIISVVKAQFGMAENDDPSKVNLAIFNSPSFLESFRDKECKVFFGYIFSKDVIERGFNAHPTYVFFNKDILSEKPIFPGKINQLYCAFCIKFFFTSPYASNKTVSNVWSDFQEYLGTNIAQFSECHLIQRLFQSICIISFNPPNDADRLTKVPDISVLKSFFEGINNETIEICKNDFPACKEIEINPEFNWENIREKILASRLCQNLIHDDFVKRLVDAPDIFLNNESKTLQLIMHEYLIDGEISEPVYKWFFQGEKLSLIYVQILLLVRAIIKPGEHNPECQLIALNAILAPWYIDPNPNPFTLEILRYFLEMKDSTKPEYIPTTIDSMAFSMIKSTERQSYRFLEGSDANHKRLITVPDVLQTFSLNVINLIAYYPQEKFPILAEYFKNIRNMNFIKFATQILEFVLLLRKKFAKKPSMLFVILNCCSFVEQDHYYHIKECFPNEYKQIFGERIFVEIEFDGAHLDAYSQINKITDNFIKIQNCLIDKFQLIYVDIPINLFMPPMSLSSFRFNDFYASTCFKYCMTPGNMLENPENLDNTLKKYLKGEVNFVWPKFKKQRFDFTGNKNIQDLRGNEDNLDVFGFYLDDWEFILEKLIIPQKLSKIKELKKYNNQSGKKSICDIFVLLSELFDSNLHESLMDFMEDGEFAGRLLQSDKSSIFIPDDFQNSFLYQALPSCIKTLMVGI